MLPFQSDSQREHPANKRGKKKQHAQSITVKVTLQVNHVFFRTSVILSPVIHVCVMSGMKNTIYPLLYNVLK